MLDQCLCVGMCDVSTVGKISHCEPAGPGVNPQPGRELNFVQPFFMTPSTDRDVRPLVSHQNCCVYLRAKN